MRVVEIVQCLIKSTLKVFPEITTGVSRLSYYEFTNINNKNNKSCEKQKQEQQQTIEGHN